MYLRKGFAYSTTCNFTTLHNTLQNNHRQKGI